uniref:Uncharacterized protein n=1 Tax=Erythrolobus australicus TaxID=1077150 RepID=A0A7S1TJU7_9RHOD|mmetsp:Transcript_1021/g.2948  ORF Transcript_1021/g.2948 Transcript_1021/m.2948 type:complete len:543 (+) Transcript_1021:266-1894(+)
MATGMSRIFSSESLRLERVASTGSFAELERNVSIGSFTRLLDGNAMTSSNLHSSGLKSAATAYPATSQQQAFTAKSGGPTPLQTPQQTPRTTKLSSNLSFSFMPPNGAAAAFFSGTENGVQMLHRVGSSAALDGGVAAAMLEGAPFLRTWSTSSFPQLFESKSHPVAGDASRPNTLLPSQSALNMTSLFEQTPSFPHLVGLDELAASRALANVGEKAASVIPAAAFAAVAASAPSGAQTSGLVWNESMNDFISSLSSKLKSTEHEASAFAAKQRPQDVVAVVNDVECEDGDRSRAASTSTAARGVSDEDGADALKEEVQKAINKKRPRKRHQQALNQLRRQLEILKSRASVIGQLSAVYAAEAKFLLSSGEQLRRENEYFSQALSSARQAEGAHQLYAFAHPSMHGMMSSTMVNAGSTPESAQQYAQLRSNVPVYSTPATSSKAPLAATGSVLIGSSPIAFPVVSQAPAPWMYPASFDAFGSAPFRASQPVGNYLAVAPQSQQQMMTICQALHSTPASASALTTPLGHENAASARIAMPRQS